MDKEYTIGYFGKIFYGTISVAMIGFSIFMLKHIHQGYFLIMPILLIIGAFVVIINQFKRKVIITPESIKRINLFKTTELYISDIKGFRVGDKAVSIYPADKNNAKIYITDYTSIANSDEMVSDLKKIIPDLDQQEYTAEEHNILSNEALGLTTDERQAYLKKAKLIALVYNVIGIIIFITVLIFATNVNLKRNPVIDLFLFTYLTAGFLIIIFSKGIVKLFSKKNDPASHIFIGSYSPAVILFVKSIVDYDVFRTTHFWHLFLLTSLILLTLVVIFIIKKLDKTFISQFAIGIILTLIIGYSGVILINCTFDSSESQSFNAVVVRHSVIHSQHTFYHIILDTWGPKSTQSDITVSESTYDRLAIGNTVSIKLKKGNLGVPWYYLPE